MSGKSTRKSHRSCEICGIREAHYPKPLFFANFPLDENRCREWVQACGNEDLVHLPIEKLHSIKHVCGLHFKKTQFSKNGKKLKKRAVPCLFLKSSPLSDDKMIGFPLHIPLRTMSKTMKKPETEVATTSSHAEQSIQVAVSEGSQNTPTATTSSHAEQLIHELSPSTSKGVKRQLPEMASSASDTHSQGVKRKLDESEAFTPRKKKLVERLMRTKCTLRSLKKSSVLIEKIESPALKELVINYCKNQKRQPKGRRWTTQHKISCLAILKRSAKAYRYLSAVVTLPSIKTLQNILKKVPMQPGICKALTNHLKSIAPKMDDKNKICCLTFDEMAIKSRIFYNEANDVVEGFEDLGEHGRSSNLADHALVFLLQGLRKKFKQPLAYYFTKGTIKSADLAKMIKEIITEVTACGFTILNTVCDQGPTNMGALKLLRDASGPYEDGSNHYFMVNGKKVYIMYDIPHLFKSLRNNFLKAGTVHLGKNIGKFEHLVEMESNNREFLYLSKISQAHINPKYKAKMRVMLAAQLLSNTVAAILKLMARSETGKKREEVQGTAQVVQDLDLLFDITNGPSGPKDTKKQRRNVSENSGHMEKWVDYIKMLTNTKFVYRNGFESKNVKCIDGYIISLKSLRDIWVTLKSAGFTYLNLRNLNQDGLENLFGVIRQHSPTNRNPTASHFTSALKTSIVTGLTAPHSRGANCEADNKKLLTDFHDFLLQDGDATHPTPGIITETTDAEIQLMEDEEVTFLEIPEEEIETDFSLIEEQPTVYVAGYLASQLLKKNACPKCKESLTVENPEDNPMYGYIFLREWYQNKFCLTYPSINFCNKIKTLVEITEKDLLPQLHQRDICVLGSTLFSLDSQETTECTLHSDIITKECYEKTSKLFIRRQCQRINRGLASKEEELASLNKRAEQQGRAK